MGLTVCWNSTAPDAATALAMTPASAPLARIVMWMFLIKLM